MCRERSAPSSVLGGIRVQALTCNLIWNKQRWVIMFGQTCLKAYMPARRPSVVTAFGLSPCRFRSCNHGTRLFLFSPLPIVAAIGLLFTASYTTSRLYFLPNRNFPSNTRCLYPERLVSGGVGDTSSLCSILLIFADEWGGALVICATVSPCNQRWNQTRSCLFLRSFLNLVWELPHLPHLNLVFPEDVTPLRCSLVLSHLIHFLGRLLLH